MAFLGLNYGKRKTEAKPARNNRNEKVFSRRVSHWARIKGRAGNHMRMY